MLALLASSVCMLVSLGTRPFILLCLACLFSVQALLTFGLDTLGMVCWAGAGVAQLG